MKIGKPEVREGPDGVIYAVSLRANWGQKELWYSVGKKFGHYLSHRSDAALVALLIPAMAQGDDIVVDGAISERLYYNIHRYMRLLRHVMPVLRGIQVYCSEVESGNAQGSAVATGFSGGIDFFCTLADHYYFEVPLGFRITHLLFNNVGSHGSGEKGAELFNGRYTRMQPGAEAIGLPLLKVDSNLDTFYGDALRFQQTHTPRNVSVALALQAGVRRYLYASTFQYADAFIGPTYDMAYSDAVALPLISTDSVDAYSVGSEYSRVEKTLRVAKVAMSHKFLDICTNDAKVGNCSTCFKCMRTLVTLEIAGLLDVYQTVFDLAKYRSQRARFMGELIHRRDDPLLREIVAYAQRERFSFPFFSKTYSAVKTGVKAPAVAMRKFRVPDRG